MTLVILLAQAPMIGLLTLIVTGMKQPRDFPYFILAIVAVWFGTFVLSREIIRERGVYERERMVNLAIAAVRRLEAGHLLGRCGRAVRAAVRHLKLLDIADTLSGGTIGFSMPGVVLGLPHWP